MRTGGRDAGAFDHRFLLLLAVLAAGALALPADVAARVAEHIEQAICSVFEDDCGQACTPSGDLPDLWDSPNRSDEGEWNPFNPLEALGCGERESDG